MDPPQYLRSRVLKVNNQEETPITDNTSKLISLKINNKNVTHKREKFKKNLGCLPRSAMFNVVSSTALNLNALGDPSSYDRFLHFVRCCQRSDLLLCKKLASKIRLQPLGGDCECAFLKMCNLCPTMGKDLGHCERPGPSRLQFPRKEL